MSMYNMLFGNNPHYRLMLATIGLEGGDPPSNNKFDYIERFRDVFYKDGIIYVYCRLGGGNREDYEECINKLRLNEYYIKDYDDEVDQTYAIFEFKKPEGVEIKTYWREPFFDMEAVKERIDKNFN